MAEMNEWHGFTKAVKKLSFCLNANVWVQCRLSPILLPSDTKAKSAVVVKYTFALCLHIRAVYAIARSRERERERERDTYTISDRMNEPALGLLGYMAAGRGGFAD